MNKFLRVLLMAILIVLILAAAFVIFRLVAAPGEPILPGKADPTAAPEQAPGIVESTPIPATAETAAAEETPEPEATPEPTAEATEEPVQQAQALENEGDIVIIIPEDQESDGF